MLVYLAAPFGETNSTKRNVAEKARDILINKGFTVHCPWEL